MTATLADVRAGLPGAQQRGDDAVVSDATRDSRDVRPGALFCAVRGNLADGHDHAKDAVARGATALLVDRWLDLDVPQVRVPDVRAATGPAAAIVHEHPSEQMTVVGITGTNGKTTVAYLLEGAFAAAGRGAGVIGTIETRVHGSAVAGVRTTPEGTDLQRQLRTMYTRGVDAVAMEVSSHGLDLHRVDGTRFAVAAFTNLSQDHLDWHGTIEAYFAAKARLFTPEFTDRAVVVIDDRWGRQLATDAEVPVLTLGHAPDADIRIVDAQLDAEQGNARLVGLAAAGLAATDEVTVRTRLVSGFNLVNAATAVVTAVAAGTDLEAAVRGVAACPGVPGRLERVDAGQDASVLVDFAHTPDAVAQVIAQLRAVMRPGGRLTVVVGSGGDRDPTKRAPMGAAALRADVAILTSDNPRSEDPHAILAAMRTGAQQAQAAGAEGRLIIEPDRRAAIGLALTDLGPDDVVVLAGKGHETTQELADTTIEFDDRQVAAELLTAAQRRERNERR